MPGRMAYLSYVANDGTTYAIKTRDRYRTALNQTVAGVQALGFVVAPTGTPMLPKGMKPRGIYVQDPTGGAVRKLPVGAVTAPAWDGTVDTVQIDYSGIGTLTDAVIVGSFEEHRPPRLHTIVNVSDAS